MGYHGRSGHVNTGVQKLGSNLVGQLVQELRLAASLTQVELAEKLDRHQSVISKIENGDRFLHLTEVHPLCEALGLPVEDFMARLEEVLP